MKLRYLIFSLVGLIMIVGVVLVFGYHSSNQDLLKKQQAEFAKTATSDPILRFLPYGDNGYNIDATFVNLKGKRTLEVTISVVLSGSDYKLNQTDLNQVIDQREKAALQYISSKGLDPKKYSIEYSVPNH